MNDYRTLHGSPSPWFYWSFDVMPNLPKFQGLVNLVNAGKTQIGEFSPKFDRSISTFSFPHFGKEVDFSAGYFCRC